MLESVRVITYYTYTYRVYLNVYKENHHYDEVFKLIYISMIHVNIWVTVHGHRCSRLGSILLAELSSKPASVMGMFWHAQNVIRNPFKNSLSVLDKSPLNLRNGFIITLYRLFEMWSLIHVQIGVKPFWKSGGALNSQGIMNNVNRHMCT